MQDSAKGLVKNKLFTKPQKVSKMHDPAQFEDTAQNLVTQEPNQQNRIIVKRATAFGLEQADFELALQNRKTHSNRYYKGQQVPVTVDRQHFKIYGPGIYLFFSFLWKLSMLFLVLSLISIVPMVYNYIEGSRFSNSVQSLDIYISEVSISNWYGNDPTRNNVQQISKTKVPKLINCIADLLCSFIMMVFYFYWTNESGKITEEIKKTFKMPNYFTLELKQFSEDATDHDVYNFFNKFGMVTEVAPVKNYSQTINLSRQIFQYQAQMKQLKLQQAEDPSNNNSEKIQKLQNNVAKLYKQLAVEEMKSKQDVIKYYVSFSTPLERGNTVKRFHKVYDQFCLCCKTIPQDYLLKGQKVSVKPCHDQPGEIIWENVHITWKTRWMRALVQFVLLLAFVFAGFFIISSLNILTPPSALESIDTSSYTSVTILSVTNQTIVESWCLKNTDTATSTPALSNSCQKYITRYYVNLVITYSITVFVIAIKTILKKLVIFIAKFQRYKQHTEQSIDVMKNLVIIYIITTVVIGFLLQANLFGIKFKMVIPNLVNDATMKINASLLTDYAVLENNWYVDIGYQIWFTWLIMAVSPHSYMPLYFYLMECINEKFAKGEKLQKNMDKAMQPAQFEIEDHYANIIMIFLVGFVFSGGMPCMLPVTFIGIITRYAYLKFLFIRFSKVPKTIDEALNETVISYFPWTLALHFCMSIWMYSVRTIFAFEESIFSQWFKATSSSFIQFLAQILGMGVASYYYTLGAALMLICILIKEVIYNFFASVFKSEADKVEEIQKEDTENDMIGQMRSQRGLTSSYRIENNPDYSEILSIKQKMKARIENGELEKLDDKI